MLRVAAIAAVALGLFIGIKVLGSLVSNPTELIPTGTALTVRLMRPITSQSARLGDTFEGRVVSVRIGDGAAVVLPGNRVEGRCVAVRPGEGAGRPGYLRLALSGLVDDEGRFYPLETTTFSLSGEWSTQPGTRSTQDSRSFKSRPVAHQAPAAASSNEAVISPDVNLTFVLFKPAVVRARR